MAVDVCHFLAIAFLSELNEVLETVSDWFNDGLFPVRAVRQVERDLPISSLDYN